MAWWSPAVNFIGTPASLQLAMASAIWAGVGVALGTAPPQRSLNPWRCVGSTDTSEGKRWSHFARLGPDGNSYQNSGFTGELARNDAMYLRIPSNSVEIGK